MNGIIAAFLITLIGCINPNFHLLKGKPREYFAGIADRLKFGIIVSAVIAYVYMPALIFPDILVPICLMLIINCAYTMISFRNKIGQIIKTADIKKNFAVPIQIIILILIIALITPIIPLTQTEKLRDLPNAKISTEQISTTNPKEIRQVPYENAKWVADKSVGELGFKYQIGDIHIQIINDSLYWVAPLEFGNFFKWLQYRTSSGYILVDAENPSGEAKRIDNLEMRYMRSSYFQNNVYRKIYQKYPTYRFSEFSFEIDDTGRPKWVVSATRPTVWHTGEKVYGIIIVDPVAGDSKFYKRTNIPEWVDIVIPEKVAEDYNYWYGAYVHGFWNTKLAQKDMHLPTTKFGRVDVFGVKTGKGLVWFTGHTSPSTKDQSLTGYATINTKTGEMIYYANVSGYYNEEAALSTVNSKVSNFAGYYGAQPVFYNIYGELTWVVPVLSSNFKLQKIALVQASSGNTVLEDTLELALNSYRKILQTNGGKKAKIDEKEDSLFEIAEGIIERIRGDYAIIRRGTSINPHIFKISGDEALITYEGDRVRIKYVSSNSTVVDSLEFDNLEYGFE